MFPATLPIERVFELARSTVFLDDVAVVYEQLDRRVSSRQPVCINRGLCCKFKDYDHGLYVTPVELAYFVGRASQEILVDNGAGQCPYHRDGVCTTRVARPGGCRIFFCDPNAQTWQPDESEDLLNTLKALHEQHKIPYAYVEWLYALEQLWLHRDARKIGGSGSV